MSARQEMFRERERRVNAYFDTPPDPNQTWVYFVRRGEDGPIKIGISIRPDVRLGELQMGSPEPLTLLGVIEGDYTTERGLHRQFRYVHLRGEWFAPHPDLMAYIERHIRSRR